MKILIVASKFPPEYSGPGVRIPRLYKAIGPELGADVHVLCGGIEHTNWQDYEHEGLPVRRRAVPFFRGLSFLPARLQEFLTQCAESLVGLTALRAYRDVDMVHILGCSGLTAAAIWWANRRRVPIFQELVTAKARPSQRFLLWTVKPNRRAVIMALREDAAKAAKADGYESVWKRPNPVDTDIFRRASGTEKSELRAALTPFSGSDIVICTVAKLIPQKNQVFLPRVLALLPSEFKLLIAGPKVTRGPLLERDRAYYERLVGLVSEHGLDGRVHIVADYVEASDYMKLSDVYAMPAWDEGFGTPMIEAIVCGVPVIANAGEPVFAEWIRDGENGYVCELDPSSWAACCRNAGSFTDEQKKLEADKMAHIAGQKTIHGEYVRLIKNLVHQDNRKIMQ